MGMQATSKGNMPVVLLKEGGTQTKGRDAQKITLQHQKLSLKLFVPV
jgi:thermosome subunit